MRALATLLALVLLVPIPASGRKKKKAAKHPVEAPKRRAAVWVGNGNPFSVTVEEAGGDKVDARDGHHRQDAGQGR